MPKYAIGIDLGTTHSALSYLSLDATTGRGAQQAMLPVPQLVAPGSTEPKQLLPSFLYLSASAEFPLGSLALPWGPNAGGHVVGELARQHGAKVPTRLVSSAKSWLCHPTVDRRAAILPWQAPADVTKVSPVQASAKYLEHLRQAWNREFPQAPLAEQDIVLTVPASFDASARDLTLEAAKQAGLGDVTLLEEPQAALYAWLEAMGEGWRKQVKPGDVLLCVDVGGGTSDFSLIGVSENAGSLQLERLAVGDHILLGGDNMDLALAYAVNEKFKGQGKTLDAWQMNALTFACRVAKETLFESAALDKVAVTVPGRGSSLIGGTLKSEVTRAELTTLLTDGFFPPVGATEWPATPRRQGLAQVGLPYAQDAAITRHLAAFLGRQAGSVAGGHAFARPTAVLFNGGVFRAAALKNRVLDVLNSWLTAANAPPARELTFGDLDLAVARGAAHYGWVKNGHGLRIRGGTARAYYVGVESATLAVPGFTPPVKALCVAPFGMEEGTQADVPPQEFGLVVGEPTQFRFFSSTTRRDDRVGDFVEDAKVLEELTPIETALTGQPGALVPVNLQAAVTELGALEVRAVERSGPGRWKLELNVRGE